MSMMRAGLATAYAEPPTWEEAETILHAKKFSSANLFLAGRSLPGNAQAGIAAEYRMAVAWLQIDGRWTHDEEGLQPLGWTPLYLATAPALAPWPPQDHPEVIAVICGLKSNS